MARTRPQLIALLGVVDQSSEERCLERIGVLREAAYQVFRDEIRRLLSEENVAINEINPLDGDVLKPLTPHQKHDRRFQPALAHKIDKRGCFTLKALLSPVDYQTANC